MRKYLRYIIRYKSDKLHGGVEGFRYFWIQFRKKRGLSYAGKRRHSHDLTLRRRKKKKADPWKINKTGNKYETKLPIWKRIIRAVSKILGNIFKLKPK